MKLVKLSEGYDMKNLMCVLLLCFGCVVGCGLDLGPGANLAINFIQEGEINELQDQVGELEGRLDNLPVPENGIDGVTTVIVVHHRLPDPIPLPKIDPVDPVCVEVDMCHKGHTISICVASVDSHMANHEDDYLGVCD